MVPPQKKKTRKYSPRTLGMFLARTLAKAAPHVPRDGLKYVDVEKCLRWIAQGADVNTAVVLAHNVTTTPLHIAATYGNAALVTALIAAGAEINNKSNGGTALHMAVFTHRRDIIKALCRAGIDLTHKDGSGHTADYYSNGNAETDDILTAAYAIQTRLHGHDLDDVIAAQRLMAWIRDWDTPEESILERMPKTFDPDYTHENGMSLVVAAAHMGLDRIVTMMLARGANPDIPDKDGATALSIAITREQPQMVRRLLAAGAKTSIADRNGQTPAFLARTVGSKTIRDIFAAHTAREGKRIRSSTSTLPAGAVKPKKMPVPRRRENGKP